MSSIEMESVQMGQEGQLLTFCSLPDTGMVISVDTFPLLLTNKYFVVCFFGGQNTAHYQKGKQNKTNCKQTKNVSKNLKFS